jgi:hypothetical protein
MCPIRYRWLCKHTMPNREVIKLWRLEKSYSAKLVFYLYYKAKVYLKLRYKYTALIRDYPVQEAKELDYFIDK